ncbi:MAG: NAD-dependent epimerase/dehydratase family protein [Lachnospiraceae bacterium]
MGVLQEDFQGITEDPILSVKENLDRLRGASVVITGATGLVGSMLLRALQYADEEKGLSLTLIPLIRNPEKLSGILGGISKQIHPVVLDVTDRDFVEKAGDEIRSLRPAGSKLYFFHCAAVTASKTMVAKPVETILASFEGTRNLLETARVLQADGFVYLSSMEVYGDMSVYGDTRANETKLGILDVLSVRSDYPESKRLCENLCLAYAKEYGLPAKIARLAQTFGAGILPWENRVFAQFARSAVAGKDIVLHTKGLSEGNYCYTADCVRGLLTILLCGSAGEAYNVANEACHTTIGGMAEMVADRIAEGKISVVYDIPEGNVFGYAADTHLALDSRKLRSLGWEPRTDLEEMYRRMIRYMRETGMETA